MIFQRFALAGRSTFALSPSQRCRSITAKIARAWYANYRKIQKSLTELLIMGNNQSLTVAMWGWADYYLDYYAGISYDRSMWLL